MGVLSGLKVLDLSTGIAGPMTGMMLADHGASVERILPPGGDPFADLAGSRVWRRGKRESRLNLKDDRDYEALMERAAGADILIESFTPKQAKRLRLEHSDLAAANPRLIHASITGYGRDTADADRPAYDALVAARIGLLYEQRGWPEGADAHMARQEGFAPDFTVPYDWIQGPAREGPVFSASYWPSLGAFFAASLGIAAALRARGVTGEGQHVETSLLQGALAAAWGVWQRGEHADRPGFSTWVFCSRSPKGHFRCADGRWIHQWVPNPRFLLNAETDDPASLSLRSDPSRFGIGPEELVVMTHYQEQFEAAVGRQPSDWWVAAAAAAGVPLQECRPLEEALNDPLLMADGCVVELDDPEVGPIRQVGLAYRLSACPTEIRQEPAGAGTGAAAVPRDVERGALSRPLEGIRVLDFGLAVAGPYATQLLADLGADVIKINQLHDGYWHEMSTAMSCNRGKRSLAIDLKDPRAAPILRRLVEGADIVQHNMRYSAARRLGIDYDTLRQVNPQLIYCHTRGFETGPREGSPGNDQTGTALAGIQHENGAVAAGGKPIWNLLSFGDTGNGFLSAIALVHALYHRDATGEGQFVDTSIINACLLNGSYSFAFPDGTSPERPRLDREMLGLSALYRLYPCAEGWLCLAAPKEAHWHGLLRELGLTALASDGRFATAEGRRTNAAALAAALSPVLMTRTAEQWFARLDRAGVPCEVSDPDYPLRLFDDEALRDRGWIARFEGTAVGRFEQPGLCVDLSKTPGALGLPPLVVGSHSLEILGELGMDRETIDCLVRDGAVLAC